jgi:hypothetical protein
MEALQWVFQIRNLGSPPSEFIRLVDNLLDVVDFQGVDFWGIFRGISVNNLNNRLVVDNPQSELTTSNNLCFNILKSHQHLNCRLDFETVIFHRQTVRISRGSRFTKPSSSIPIFSPKLFARPDLHRLSSTANFSIEAMAESDSASSSSCSFFWLLLLLFDEEEEDIRRDPSERLMKSRSGRTAEF